MKYLLLLLVVVPAVLTAAYNVPANMLSQINRHNLSHSKAMTYTHRVMRHRLGLFGQNHQLSQVAPLDEGNHMGFTLQLVVNGLKYQLSMDTGSSDIFIKGENTTGEPKKKYQSGEGYLDLERYNIGYLDGYLKCYAKTLPVVFNDLEISMPLLIAFEGDRNFDNQGGIVGLSYPFLASHQPTFIQTLIKEKIIDRYAYGMNLNLIEADRSFVTFGDDDPALYQGNLTSYPILSQYYIQIQMNAMRIGKSGAMKMSTALLDTGNTCISIPSQFTNQILAGFNQGPNECQFWLEENVPKFSLLVCKVLDFDLLPNISITIGNSTYDIEKEFYLQRCTQNPEDSGKGPKYCETYIESVTDEHMLFLGDGFFNRFYTYFDLDQNVVGLALNRENLTMDKIYSLPSPWVPEDWAGLLDEPESTQAEDELPQEKPWEQKKWYQKLFSGLFS